MFACLYFPDLSFNAADLGRLANEFSPLYEIPNLNTILLSLQGLERRHESHAAGGEWILRELQMRGYARARVAIASTLDVALFAAKHRSQAVCVVPPGTESRFLAGLPVACLPLSPGMLETLESWGIRNFGEFAALPPMGIAERWGEEGYRLLMLAQGKSNRPLVQYLAPATFEQRIELEDSIELLEPLLLVLNQALVGLCRGLQTHTLATDRFTLAFGLENHLEDIRRNELPVPIDNAKTLLKLIQLELEARPLRAAVKALTIRLRPASPRHTQNNLFLPPAPEPQQLEITLKKIARLVGEDRMGSPEPLDTHRPDSYRFTRFAGKPCEPLPTGPREMRLILRVFRPPLSAAVRMEKERPLHLRTAGIGGKIVSFSGPWRTSGNWWTTSEWDREEWDVCLDSGGVYRIYSERNQSVWFVEGCYD
ncbi:MAG: hypothetical protein WD696_16645 [Bryobacteraceae bacterium]